MLRSPQADERVPCKLVNYSVCGVKTTRAHKGQSEFYRSAISANHCNCEAFVPQRVMYLAPQTFILQTYGVHHCGMGEYTCLDVSKHGVIERL